MSKRFTFALQPVPASLKAGLAALRADYVERFKAGKGALALSFVEDASLGTHGLAAAPAQGGVTVRYGSRSAAFRALGKLLAAATRSDLAFAETSEFTMRGLMADCSRNGVLRKDAAEEFMR